VKKIILIIILNIFFAHNVFAAERVVNLVIKYKTVYFAGKARKAIAVNDQIPAPTLHFKEGDHVTINVYNHLDQETAVHWHGIILPWQMDGVLGVNQHGIQPGRVFHYQFTLHQGGTYWYHAHAGLQEQQGFYGAFLIDPPAKPHYQYTKDYVVVLSDWSNTDPDQILSNLKKEGDYYSPRFPLQPSLVKFIHDYRKASMGERKNLVDDYKMMQQMRMGIYDISDVAYDAFLLNGHPKSSPWTASVIIGDVVRLRFIGAGGSTIFHVKIPDTTMQMVHVQGNDVKPYAIKDFTIAPGETYDVLVKIQKNDPYIIYAESRDTVGAAYGALITAPHQFVNYKQVTPFPEPLPVTREMMSMMMGKMNQGSLPMSMENSRGSMSHSMPSKEMDSGMKMDESMLMSHSKTTDNQKTKDKSIAVDKKPQDAMAMDMKSSSPSMPPMNMDSSMKMDESMPMNHSMPTDNKKTTNKSIAPDKKIKNAMAMEKKSSSNSMPSMKMNAGMKMDENMSMNHPMPNKSRSMSKMPMKNMSHQTGNAAMSGMQMGDGMKMDHAMPKNQSMDMSMPTEPTIIGDTLSPPNTSYTTSSGTKYQSLIAAVKTNDPNKPVSKVIKMELFGYMERFIWFINGVPEYMAKPIILEPGKRYRIIFTNTSMMRHPMHIHGHWFILRKGNGAYDPLLHTIDVQPGATMTADIDTDASGQWFFHCHLLYHMMTGMSRVFQYSTLIEITKDAAKPQNIVQQTSYINRPIVRVDEVRPIDASLVHHPMAHPIGLWLATFLDIGLDPINNSQRLTYKGLYGRDYNKLELFTNDAEMSKGVVKNADIDIFYWHLIDQFWAIKAGTNYFYRPATMPYWQAGVGIEGLMPYFIDTNVRGYYYSGSAKLDIELSRDTQITNNFFIRTGIRSILGSKTVTQAVIGSGLNQMRYIVRPYYRLMPGLNVFAEYENEQAYGAFKNIQKNEGESTSENTITLGLSLLF
jgi:CopA family copper-resistance protein